MLVRNDTLVTLSDSTVASTTDLDTSALLGVCLQAIYTNATPSAESFVAADVDVTENTITIVGHGFFTGLKVALTGTNLPTGLSATDYWIIVVDEDTIQVATSLANAVAGTEVDITAAGTTNDAEFTPATLSQVVKLQCSNDGTNFSDISGKTVTVTSAGNTVWDLGIVYYKVIRIVVTPTAGALNLSVVLSAKL